MATIAKEIKGLQTKVTFVPSHKDITHIEPLPQQPFHPSSFLSMFTQRSLAPNPCHLQLNELKLGIINADVIREMCSNLFIKNTEEARIDLAL